MGIRPGMLLAQAQAITSVLSVVDENSKRDRSSLQQLAVWAQRFSPLVGLEESPEPSSLLIDVTGCSDCFGGEEKLLEQAKTSLNHLGWQARIALADTVGTAWALSHYGPSESQFIRVMPSENQAHLRSLPLAALRLTADALDRLKKVGIEQIGQLMALPASSLPIRFGADVLLRLDQALGRVPEPLITYCPLPKIVFRHVLEYSAESVQALKQVTAMLVQRIAIELRQSCRGVRKLSCQLISVESSSFGIEVGLLRPSDDADHLLGMLCTKLENIKLISPVSEVLIEVTSDEAMIDEQMNLFENESSLRDREWLLLTEALCHRFGRNNVVIPKLIADPLPELAYRISPAANEGTTQNEEVDEKPLRHRPIRLWPTPISLEALTLTPPGIPKLLRSRSANWKVTKAYGPERLESGWWRGKDTARDYYMVETENGSRLWVFRSLMDGHWFWHGCFD